MGVNFRSCALIAIGLVATACRRDGDAGDELAKRIEAGIQLPPGSQALGSYSRYYVQKSDEVEGLYVIHSSQFVKDVEIACESGHIGTFPCGETAGEVALAQPGSRRWLQDVRDLPIPSGGGCGAVRFTYVVSTSEYYNIRCNGDH